MSMLLNALLLVLREVLEAAVLLGLLWNYSKLAQLPTRWVFPAGFIGIVIAICYAAGIELITDLWDGTGQERISSILHFAVYVPVLLLVGGLYRPLDQRFLVAAMVLIFISASIREGSEIVVYIGAFMDAPNVKSAVFSGALIGAGIGISCGILVSTFLGSLRVHQARFGVGLLLVLVASGMMLQAVALLDQASLVGHSAKAYDLEFLIAEDSVLGRLLYAVFGYDSQPTWLQIGVYLASLLVALGAVLVAKRAPKHG